MNIAMFPFVFNLSAKRDSWHYQQKDVKYMHLQTAIIAQLK